MNEPLKPGGAKRAIIGILAEGTISWNTSTKSHFLEEMAKDKLTIPDCMNVLRGGVVDPAEWSEKFAEWRYRVHTNKICVVITFVADDELFIVTTWRKQ